MSIESTRSATAADDTTDPTDPTDAAAPAATDAAAGPSPTRRAFLGGAGTAVAVGGLLTVVPRFAAGSREANQTDQAIAEAADRLHVSPDDPLVVHVSDLASGEINVYAGDQHVVIHDTDLASRLALAVR
jgi:hypothetical protein